MICASPPHQMRVSSNARAWSNQGWRLYQLSCADLLKVLDARRSAQSGERDNGFVRASCSFFKIQTLKVAINPDPRSLNDDDGIIYLRKLHTPSSRGLHLATTCLCVRMLLTWKVAMVAIKQEKVRGWKWATWMFAPPERGGRERRRFKGGSANWADNDDEALWIKSMGNCLICSICIGARIDALWWRWWWCREAPPGSGTRNPPER